jgi:multiple sugar transport system permease protein
MTTSAGELKEAKRRPRWSIGRRTLRKNLNGYRFVLPWIISLCVFTAYPMVYSIYLSMTEYTVLNPPRWVGLHNFDVMLNKDPLFWKSAYNSAYYAVIMVPLRLVVALGLALLLAQKLRGIGFFRTVYYLPALMPAVATTILFLFLLDPLNGIVNIAMRAVGLPRIGWLNSAMWSKPGLILMSLWAGTGWQMMVFLAALKDIPEELLEAATMDGANSWQRFRKVTVPLITPAIYFNLIMGIIGSFQVFASAYVAAGAIDPAYMGTAGPLNSLLMYMLLLYQYAFRYFDMGHASAMAVVLFIILVIFTYIVTKLSGRWVYYESAGRR